MIECVLVSNAVAHVEEDVLDAVLLAQRTKSGQNLLLEHIALLHRVGERRAHEDEYRLLHSSCPSAEVSLLHCQFNKLEIIHHCKEYLYLEFQAREM